MANTLHLYCWLLSKGKVPVGSLHKNVEETQTVTLKLTSSSPTISYSQDEVKNWRNCHILKITSAVGLTFTVGRKETDNCGVLGTQKTADDQKKGSDWKS